MERGHPQTAQRSDMRAATERFAQIAHEAAHIGARALAPVELASALQFGQRLAQRADGHTQPRGQIGLGGQTLALQPAAGGNLARQQFADLHVQRQPLRLRLRLCGGGRQGAVWGSRFHTRPLAAAVLAAAGV